MELVAFSSRLLNVFTRWLLALVKSGKTLRACPRCFTLTTQFRELSLPETNFLRTSSDMRNLCHLGRELLSNSDSASKGEELFKYYSMHNIQVFDYHYLGIIFAKQLNVQNAFWELPQPFFDIHGSMLVDECRIHTHIPRTLQMPYHFAHHTFITWFDFNNRYSYILVCAPIYRLLWH